jgi:hypothetical protein
MLFETEMNVRAPVTHHCCSSIPHCYDNSLPPTLRMSKAILGATRPSPRGQARSPLRVDVAEWGTICATRESSYLAQNENDAPLARRQQRPRKCHGGYAVIRSRETVAIASIRNYVDVSYCDSIPHVNLSASISDRQSCSSFVAINA